MKAIGVDRVLTISGKITPILWYSGRAPGFHLARPFEGLMDRNLREHSCW